MKNITDTITAAKDLQDAMVSFGSSITRAMIETQAKTWEEMIRFGEATNKIAAESAKDLPFLKGFNGFNGLFGK